MIAAGSQDWLLPGFIEAVREIGAFAIELTDQLPDQTGQASSAGPLRMYAECPLPLKISNEATDDVAVMMQTSGTTGRPKTRSSHLRGSHHFVRIFWLERWSLEASSAAR